MNSVPTIAGLLVTFTQAGEDKLVVLSREKPVALVGQLKRT